MKVRKEIYEGMDKGKKTKSKYLILSFILFFVFLSSTRAVITLISPEDGAWTSGTKDTIEFVFNHTLAREATCTLYINGTERGSKVVPAGESVTFYSNSTIYEGRQEWYVKCKNETSEEISSRYTLNVDRTEPKVDLLSPEDGGWINNFVFKFNVTDNLADILSCKILINGNVLGTESVWQGENSIRSSQIADGKYNWEINCSDRAGNSKLSASRTVNIDTKSPVVVLESPSDWSYTNKATITFRFNVSDNLDTVMNCSLYIDDRLNQSISAENGTSKEIAVDRISEGIHSWEIRCKDEVNIGYSEKRKIVIDFTKPSISLSSPLDGYITDDSTPTFGFNVGDNLSPKLNCSLIIIEENIEESAIVEKGYATITSSRLTDGDKSWKIKCRDLAGNENESQIWRIRIIPHIDVILPSPGTVYTGNDTLDIKITSDQLLSSAKLEWNGVNDTVPFACDGYSCVGRKSGLVSGVTNKFRVWASGSKSGYWGVSGERDITYLISFRPPSAERAFVITLVELPIITWSAIVIVIVCILLAIGFMLSKLFVIPEWEAWIRNEFGQVMYSILLLVLFAAFAGVYDSIASEMAKSILQQKKMVFSYNVNTGRWSWAEGTMTDCPSPCHLYIARGFMGYVYERGGGMYKGLVNLYAKSYFIESIAVGGSFGLLIPKPGLLGFGFGYPLYAGRAVYNNALKTAAINLGKLLPYIKLQEMFLYYVPAIIAPLFPFGVILRIPFFTRKLGGLLIAICFGIYFVFPLTYILGWYTIDVSQVNIGESLKLASDARDLFTIVPDIGPLFDDGSVYDAIGKYYIPAYFLPIFALLVTLGFIKHFSPMIGGDTEIAGLSRLI
jgi:hypothetical protein